MPGMTLEEIYSQVGFMLGFTATENNEGIKISDAVDIAFRELKRYMRTSVDKTVPYNTRIDLKKYDIYPTQILSVNPSTPRIGFTMSSLNTGNVFQLAASLNSGSMSTTTPLNLDPIMNELSLAQLRNTMSTDLQWRWDRLNEVLYVTHRDPIPTAVTIRYSPDFQDASEIADPAWQDYLIRMAIANMKIALGRARSKYTIEGSNVTLDGDTLLNEGNSELEAIRNEIDTNRSFMVIVN